MTFTEAAVEILRRAGKPLHFKEIAESAVRDSLLSHVGQDPETIMGQRLAALARREEERKIVAVAPEGTFALADWKPPVEAFRIHKICNDVTVPALARINYKAGTPPERRYQLKN